MESFCTRLGISQEFSTAITPQQNGVVERKNMVIQEMARAMLHNKDMARNLWGEAVNTACHTVNRVYFRPNTKKTPYELWKGRKPNVKYFRIFGSTCFILKNKKKVGVDTPFCNLHLTSHGGYKGNFALGICILILAIRSLISFHQNDLDVVTIKSTSHKP